MPGSHSLVIRAKINMDDAMAEKIIADTVPIYYLTGSIHSTETGSPTALMELVYRLAVDESPYIKNIRDNLVTLVTPVVEVDGRNRMVDVYNWHLANPGKNWPNLIYWGHYVAHDNNRDAMASVAEFDAKCSQHIHELECSGTSRSSRIISVSL